MVIESKCFMSWLQIESPLYKLYNLDLTLAYDRTNPGSWSPVNGWRYAHKCAFIPLRPASPVRLFSRPAPRPSSCSAAAQPKHIAWHLDRCRAEGNSARLLRRTDQNSSDPPPRTKSYPVLPSRTIPVTHPRELTSLDSAHTVTDNANASRHEPEPISERDILNALCVSRTTLPRLRTFHDLPPDDRCYDHQATRVSSDSLLNSPKLSGIAREPGSTMIIPGHEHEILSCDWNKYDECLIASASVDKSIKIWDVRNYRVPVSVLNGHGYAVRKIKFSPHRRNLIVSCSYDMTVCLWDFMIEDALVGRYDHHTEFAVGVDLSVLVDGLMASTGWDELVYVWQQGMDPRAA
ncbi:hypothetical protein GOBAR_AA15333 [Gossypium barbadense]|uniref:Peroxin-7 n=1 Tax=Gossypium barbadense TaxID=3634 RepID=A0A2P5XPS4_GOSBA|nr:hypothetical protein GOBAR_AA15333 [Gossypium barbadense]